ncbi:MAG: ComF family protein [Piscirickettsiaceae bacterium]|nr:ComF family protein [Piscirickettsiaceae bacterium]
MIENALPTIRQRVVQLYSNLTATHCLLCGAIDKGSCLCVACINQLPKLENSCPRCASPVSHNLLCGSCLQHPPEQNSSVSLFVYASPIDRLIADFKYHDMLFLSHFFAEQMVEQLKYRPLPQLLIPIPLHPRRLRERGYNQSLELAKQLSKQLSIAVCSKSLIRIKDSQPQTSLPYKEREKNIQRAFKVVNTMLPTHIALIDDVLTTGHTANSAAKTLRQAGVINIEVWTIARTIRQD